MKICFRYFTKTLQLTECKTPFIAKNYTSNLMNIGTPYTEAITNLIYYHTMSNIQEPQKLLSSGLLYFVVYNWFKLHVFFFLQGKGDKQRESGERTFEFNSCR